MVLESILLATLGVSLLSFVGLLAMPLSERQLNRVLFILMSFATGTLFGAAFLDLFPEALETLPSGVAFSTALAGLVSFFILEKLVHWHHHVHQHQSGEKPLAILNLVGDGAHNFFDGAAIAASFMAGWPVGVSTTIAVIVHEVPQEIGDYSLLIYSGMSKARALFFNLLSALTAVIGALAFYFYSGLIEHAGGLGLAFTAGMFIYIGGAGVVPELHKELDPRKSALQVAFMLLGVGFIAWVTSLGA